MNKPLVFNYKQYERLREAHGQLVEENERLKHDKTNLEIRCRIAESEGKWIPCTERLPEENELVIVSLGNGYNAVDFDHRTRGADNVQYWYDWDGYVEAWMPMPKPYRKGETR